MKKLILSLITIVTCSSAVAQTPTIELPKTPAGSPISGQAGPQNNVHCPAGSVYKWDSWIESIVGGPISDPSHVHRMCSSALREKAYLMCLFSCLQDYRDVAVVTPDNDSYVFTSSVSDAGLTIQECGQEILCCCRGQTLTPPSVGPLN